MKLSSHYSPGSKGAKPLEAVVRRARVECGGNLEQFLNRPKLIVGVARLALELDQTVLETVETLISRDAQRRPHLRPDSNLAVIRHNVDMTLLALEMIDRVNRFLNERHSLPLVLGGRIFLT